MRVKPSGMGSVPYQKGAPSSLTLFLPWEDARGGEPSPEPDRAGTLVRFLASRL